MKSKKILLALLLFVIFGAALTYLRHQQKVENEIAINSYITNSAHDPNAFLSILRVANIVHFYDMSGMYGVMGSKDDINKKINSLASTENEEFSHLKNINDSSSEILKCAVQMHDSKIHALKMMQNAFSSRIGSNSTLDESQSSLDSYFQVNTQCRMLLVLEKINSKKKVENHSQNPMTANGVGPPITGIFPKPNSSPDQDIKAPFMTLDKFSSLQDGSPQKKAVVDETIRISVGLDQEEIKKCKSSTLPYNMDFYQTVEWMMQGLADPKQSALGPIQTALFMTCSNFHIFTGNNRETMIQNVLAKDIPYAWYKALPQDVRVAIVRKGLTLLTPSYEKVQVKQECLNKIRQTQDGESGLEKYVDHLLMNGDVIGMGSVYDNMDHFLINQCQKMGFQYFTPIKIGNAP